MGHLLLVAGAYLLVRLVIANGQEMISIKQLMLLLFSFFVCSVHFQNQIENRTMLRIISAFKTQFKIVVFSQALWLLLVWGLKVGTLPFRTAVYTGALSLFLMMLWFWVARRVILVSRAKGRNSSGVIIVGTNRMAVDLYRKTISYIPNGYRFGGFFTTENSLSDDLQNLKTGNAQISGSIADVIPYLRKGHHVDEIYFTVPIDKDVMDIVAYADSKMIRCNFLLDLHLPSSRNYGVSVVNGVPVVNLHDEPLSNLENIVKKRTFDIVFSLLFLCTLFPFLLLIFGSIIKLTSKGDVFFKQKRTGLDGKDFYCWKFRTMCQNEDSDKVQAVKNDSRITKIGAFLRKSNIDETPQFINVLLGSMSVVGPRPHMLSHTEMYSERINSYMLRHIVKPGITGWAQVNGFRGETKHLSEMKGRVEKDIWYIENWSFKLDLKIILKTITNMLQGEAKAY
jgi:putative colanic acid biosynthesis UDP-glucose lipid carrier transferase